MDKTDRPLPRWWRPVDLTGGDGLPDDKDPYLLTHPCVGMLENSRLAACWEQFNEIPVTDGRDWVSHFELVLHWLEQEKGYILMPSRERIWHPVWPERWKNG